MVQPLTVAWLWIPAEVYVNEIWNDEKTTGCVFDTGTDTDTCDLMLFYVHKTTLQKQIIKIEESKFIKILYWKLVTI